MEDIMACNVSSASLKRSSAEGGIWKQSNSNSRYFEGRQRASLMSMMNEVMGSIPAGIFFFPSSQLWVFNMLSWRVENY